MRELNEFQRLHPGTILIEFLALLRSIGGALLIFLVLRMMSGGGDTSEIIFAALGGFQILIAIFRYLSLRYAVQDGGLVLQQGFVFKQLRTIPIERIHNVNLKRGLVHRLLKVVEVQIETASGAGAEASLSVLSENQAQTLLAAIGHGRAVSASSSPQFQIGEEVTTEPEPEPVYKATSSQLFLAGATENRAGRIIAAVFGLLIYTRDRIEDIPRLAEGAFRLPSQQATVLVFGGIAILLWIGGWFLSIVTTFVTNYGFTLRSGGGLLRLEKGLFTHLENTVTPGRVQAVRVEQPMVQRWLGYANVFAVSAGSYGEKEAGGTTNLTPLIEWTRVASLLQLVYPSASLGEVEWQQVSRKTIRRSFARGVIWFAILFGLLYPAIGWQVFLGYPFALLIAWLYARKRYEVLGYHLADEHLFVRGGVFRRVFWIVPRHRIQWTRVDNSYFQRRMGLADLSVQTLASTTSIPDLPIDVAVQLQDLLSASSNQVGTATASRRSARLLAPSSLTAAAPADQFGGPDGGS